MNDTVLTAHIEHTCRTSRNGIVVLWYADSFDDRLHISKMKSIETLFDLCIGGTAVIAGHTWQMFEQKCADREGIYVYLRRLPEQATESASQKPRTREEWKAWAIQYYQEHGKPLVEDCTCTHAPNACDPCKRTIEDGIGEGTIPY